MPSNLDLAAIKAAYSKWRDLACGFDPDDFIDGWGRDDRDNIAFLLNATPALVAEVERLRSENFALAAHQCKYPSGDDYGNPVCEEVERLKKENEVLKAEAIEAADNSDSFGGDCWQALRSLLSECNWNWSQDPEVTADDAREHISTTIAEFESSEQRLKAEIESLCQQLATAEASARDFEAVCMTQEGQIARLMQEAGTAKAEGAAEDDAELRIFREMRHKERNGLL